MLTNTRYAVRSLAKSPGFSLVAIATLAIGIGAVTALFTIVHGVLMKPLDYPDADRIVAVVNQFKGRTGPTLAGGDEIDIAADTTALDTAYYFGGEMGVQLGDRAEFVGVRLVHPNFFRVFAVAPVAGRTFNNDDALRSAIVSDGFAVRNFGSAANAIGRRVFHESRTYDIVGVMPARMQFPAETDVWAAAALEPENQNRTGHNYRVIARLAPGMSLTGANTRLAALSQRLAHDFPISNSDTTFATVSLREFLTGPVRTTLVMLLGAAALVLLIACANVANLMLARGAIRAREVAVRTALGASRGQILGLCLAESLVLASVACAIGLVLASAGTTALLRIGARALALPRVGDVTVDWRVSMFAAGMSLVTVLVCGFAPAMQAARVSLRDALNHGGTRGTTSGPSSRMRAGLMIAQIALSYALAIDAGLLVRSFVAMTETSLGFRSDGVLVMYAHAPAHRAESEEAGLPAYLRIGRFFDDVLGTLRRQPDVVSVGGVMGLPTGQYSSNGSYAVEGVSSFDGDTRRLPTAGFRLASPGYFETLEIPVLRGRAFNDGDIFERPAVAIISESLARATFGRDDPIGHRIQCGFDRANVWMTVVGVVGDVRQASPASQPGPELYMPLRQHPFMANEVQIVVRGRGAPDSLIPSVRQLVRAANPDVAMKFVTLDTSVRTSIAAPRFRATLVGTFAILALLLAAAGTYSVMSYMTARRAAEFGVRMALGARANDLARLVLGDAMRLAIAGIAIGLGLALVTSRVVTGMLFGVTSNDISTHVLVMLTALPAVLAAAAIPALRAARTDPIDALKSE